jgi:hypothetical protein
MKAILSFPKGLPVPRPVQAIEDLLRNAVSQAMRTIAPAIHRHVAAVAAEELEKSLAVTVKNGAKPSRGPSRHARARSEEITKWVAGRSARRVPKFVIELTGGLDTKKKIVAKFGEDAAFEKGKPPPKPAKAA